MKSQFLLLLVCFLLYFCWSEGFITRVSTGAEEWAKGSAVDPDGSVYVVGGASGASLEDGYTLQGEDAYVIKFLSSGEVAWKRMYGTSGKDGAYDVVHDGDESVWVCGYSKGAYLPDDGGQAAGGEDFTLVQLEQESGETVHTLQRGTPASDRCTGVSMGGNGVVYLVGETAGDWDDDSVDNGSTMDTFVGSYDPDSHTMLFLVRYDGCAAHDEPTHVAVNPATQDVYVSGKTAGAHAQATETYAGEFDGFVAKFNSVGHLQWVHLVGTSSAESATRIAFDSNTGSVYVGGYTMGDLFGQKNNLDGDWWVKRFGSDGSGISSIQGGFERSQGNSQSLFGMTLDSGFLYISGDHRPTTHKSFTSGGDELTDSWMIKLDSSLSIKSRVETRGYPALGYKLSGGLEAHDGMLYAVGIVEDSDGSNPSISLWTPLCPPGTNGSLSDECPDCGEGYYGQNDNAVPSMAVCTGCPIGYSSEAGSTLQGCKKCFAGSYSETEGSSCTKCPDGTYTLQDGSTSQAECRDAPKGYIVPLNMRCGSSEGYTFTPKKLKLLQGNDPSGPLGTRVDDPELVNDSSSYLPLTAPTDLYFSYSVPPAIPYTSTVDMSIKMTYMADANPSTVIEFSVQLKNGSWYLLGTNEDTVGGFVTFENTNLLVQGIYTDDYSYDGDINIRLNVISSGNPDVYLDYAAVTLTCNSMCEKTDGVCPLEECEAGTYQDTSGKTSCKICGKGSYGVLSGAESKDECMECPSGTYSDEDVASECTQCPAGTAQGDIGATSRSSCEACGAGTWSGPGSSQCVPCGPGFYGTVDGGTSSSVCKSCAIGTYQPLLSAELCTKCPVGWYSSAENSTQCTACPLGTFGNSTGLSSCYSCPEGYSSSASGSTECSQCSAGTYSSSGESCETCPLHSYSEEGASECTDCPLNGKTEIVGAQSVQLCSCLDGSYGDPNNGVVCEDCPVNANCAGGSQTVPYANEGFWLSLDEPDVVVACIPASACPGGVDACADGYFGDGCRLCQENYYRANGKCNECNGGGIPPEVIIGLVVTGILLIPLVFCCLLVVSGYLYAWYASYDFLNSTRGVSNGSMLSSIMGMGSAVKGLIMAMFLVVAKSVKFTQFMGVVYLLGIEWPVTVDTFFQYMQLLSFHYENLIQPECQGNSVFSFDIIFVARLVIPGTVAVVGLVLALAGSGCWSVLQFCFSKEQEYKGISTVPLNVVLRGCIQMILLLYVFLHVSSLSLFHCTELVEGEWYLVESPDIRCFVSGGTWIGLLPWSLLGFFVYSLGVPFGLFCIMYRHYGAKKRDVASPTAVRFSFLWSGYEPDFFWWELAVTIQKFLFGLSVLFATIGTAEQLIFQLVMSMFSLLVMLRLTPYSRFIEDIAELNILFAVFYTILAGLVFSSGDTGATAVTKYFFEVTLIMVVIYVWLFFVYIFVADWKITTRIMACLSSIIRFTPCSRCLVRRQPGKDTPEYMQMRLQELTLFVDEFAHLLNNTSMAGEIRRRRHALTGKEDSGPVTAHGTFVDVLREMKKVEREWEDLGGSWFPNGEERRKQAKAPFKGAERLQGMARRQMSSSSQGLLDSFRNLRSSRAGSMSATTQNETQDVSIGDVSYGLPNENFRSSTGSTDHPEVIESAEDTNVRQDGFDLVKEGNEGDLGAASGGEKGGLERMHINDAGSDPKAPPVTEMGLLGSPGDVEDIINEGVSSLMESLRTDAPARAGNDAEGGPAADGNDETSPFMSSVEVASDGQSVKSISPVVGGRATRLSAGSSPGSATRSPGARAAFALKNMATRNHTRKGSSGV